MSNTELEIWKDIKDYEGLYQISSLGRVKSLWYGKERILNQSICKGYCRVVLCKDAKQKKYLVHRLVAQAFLPNPNNYPCVNHKDENKINNCVSNLEWCSYQYNNSYATRLERCSKSMIGRKQSQEHIEKRIKANKGKKRTQETKDKMSIAHKGKISHQKPILQLSKSGNIILRKWDSISQASNELGIYQQSICKCCKGKNKTAGKFKWMYYDDYINRMNNYFDLALKEVS